MLLRVASVFGLVAALFALLPSASLATHHVFHITNNASSRITAITLVYHLDNGSTVQQSYNISVPLRIIKDVAIPHSVVTSGGTYDTSEVCNMDLAISYANGTSVWLRNTNLCSTTNVEALDSTASAYYNAQYATPRPDITPQAVATPAPQPTVTPRTPSEEAVHRGEQMFDKGRFAAALPFFTSAIKLAPRYQFAYAYRSRTYFLMNDFPHSLADADAGLRVDTDYPLLHWIRGNTEWASGLNDSAIEDYGVTAQQYPKVHGYMTVLSVFAARESGDSARAKSLLAACPTRCPDSDDSTTYLQYLQGKLTARDLLNAAKDNSARAEAHAIIGFNVAERGKTAEARQHFQYVLRYGDPYDNWRPIIRLKLAKMR